MGCRRFTQDDSKFFGKRLGSSSNAESDSSSTLKSDAMACGARKVRRSETTEIRALVCKGNVTNTVWVHQPAGRSVSSNGGPTSETRTAQKWAPFYGPDSSVQSVTANGGPSLLARWNRDPKTAPVLESFSEHTVFAIQTQLNKGLCSLPALSALFCL